MRSQSYRKITLSSLRFIIILSLALSVLTKPVFTFLLQITDVQYELFEDFENNGSTENEVENDSEQEEQSILYTNFTDIEINNSFIKSFFNILNNIIDFNPIIHLPPPKN